MATQAKKDMRTRIKLRLAELTDGVVQQQSARAQSTIQSLPQYRDARSIGIYLSMPSGEAQTDQLVRDALGQGKAVYVPYIYSGPEGFYADSEGKRSRYMDMLQLDSIAEYESLERDSWGIPTLPRDDLLDRKHIIGGRAEHRVGASTSVAPNLDLIVMPAVAFDREMNRLGHGAAFYDIFLKRLCKDHGRRKPFLVGLCLTEQVLPQGETLVTQSWDWKVDAVAVGDGQLLTLQDIS